MKAFLFGQWDQVHCESPFNCAVEILLLTYLLTSESFRYVWPPV